MSWSNRKVVKNSPMHLAVRLAGAASTAIWALLVCASPQPAKAFTSQITMTVAGTAGGGIDLYARMLGRHMGRHIPGNPSIVVQDMPGAGGIRAAHFMAQRAPRDGSMLGMFPGGPLLEPLIGARNPGYDMSQFRWIGAISRDVSVCVAWAATPFKTIDDVKTTEMIVAGTGAASETDFFPIILNKVMGTRFKVVTGYLGSRETFLAIESGEAHGRCGLTYPSLKAARPDWLRDRKLNILLQLGLERSAELPDAPLASELISDPEDKQLVDMLVTSTAIGRPLAAPPETPADRIDVLRRAFDATMRDPAFLEEGRRIQAEISPTAGEEVQGIIARLYATPEAVVRRAKSLLPAK
jgi:tripartite-type tricarboxylate transporter receptor subunit TctC